jgi:hypothetical protein
MTRASTGRRRPDRAVAVWSRVRRCPGGQGEVRGRERRLELLHGAWPDDRRGDAGVMDTKPLVELALVLEELHVEPGTGPR